MRATNFGTWRPLTPVSRSFGTDRGQGIDRYYIERFLQTRAQDIHGHVLEIGDDTYTKRFGRNRVTHCDILHVTGADGKATLVADLTRADHLPSASVDCVIFTQTLQHIADVRAAVRTLHRMVKPKGTVLATFPGISHISRYDMDRWGDYWRFTTLSARWIFEEWFGSGNVTVNSYGNVFVAMAFLHGLAAQELRPEELAHQDPDYQVLITLRAVKQAMTS